MSSDSQVPGVGKAYLEALRTLELPWTMALGRVSEVVWTGDGHKGA